MEQRASAVHSSMPTLMWRTLAEHASQAVLVGASLIPTLALVRVFAARMTYPTDLEWCEGGSAYMAWRVLHHLPVYVKPGDIFAPFPYPPGHTLALALAGLVSGGLDYGPARAVSVLAYVLLNATIFAVVKGAFTDRSGIPLGCAAIAMLACSFPAVGGWYDLVRVDSMMIAFSVLAAALVAAPGLAWGRTLAASLAMTIAVFTKQTAAFFAVWICLFAMVRNWREGLRLSLVMLACCVVALAWLLRVSRGNAWFWMFENLASHPIELKQLSKGLGVVGGFAPFAPLVPVVFLVLAFLKRATSRTWLWVGMLLVAVPAALLPYAKNGGWTNDMIPVIVLLVPAAMHLSADILRAAPRAAVPLRIGLCLASLTFILLRPVHADAFMPKPVDWQRAQSLNAFVSSLNGGLLAPQMAFLPARNGQVNPHWHRMGHADLTWSGHTVDEGWAVERSQAHYALLNANDRGDFGRAIRRQFRLVGQMPEGRRVKMLAGGGVVDLDQLWERLPAPGDAPGR